MASSAVSSVLYLRDAAGNHTETRTGACIYCGDAASVHEWEFRTRLRIAGKSGDQYIEAMSKVCDGLRGDAFVAAQEVGFDNLCELVDGRPHGIDTLIQPHARNGFFPFDRTRTQRNIPPVLPPWRTPVQAKWRKVSDSMSRDDDVVGHSCDRFREGHRPETLLDLSGLTREERVMLQASTSNERDVDRVAEAFIIQHPRIHLKESQRRVKGKGKDGFKRVDNSNTRWFRGKGKGKNTVLRSNPAANLTSVEDYDYYDEDMDESANACQVHNDPVDRRRRRSSGLL